ncbi:Prenylcysteine oxidase [Dirofilaria immitis]
MSLKIAIIGGGIGGASSAYFLRTLVPSEANIEINLFNHGNIGGRLTTVQMPYNGKIRMFEAGGSVLHPANLYLKNWMEKFGLHKKNEPLEKGVTGIWNGQEFVFLESPYYLITLYRLLKRYGFDQLKSRFEIKNLLSNFENIYVLLDQGKSFDSIDAMVMAMSIHLAKLVNKTMEEHLIENGYHDPFIVEFTNAALNCNYGQFVKEIGAFVGSVGLAGSASGLYSVNGSNKLIVQKLIDYSKAKLVNAEVTTVSKRNNRFVLYGNDGQKLSANYDYVIVAVPLHQKQQIQIEGVNCKGQRGRFKQITTTFLEGSLRARHWLLSENDKLTTVIACNNSLSYNAIEQLSPVDYQENESLPRTSSNEIWKIFSSKRLADSELSLYFSEIKSIKRIPFLAYPEYKKYPADRPQFRLAKNICFVNAVEWLASTIEMSAIGGQLQRNPVLTINYNLANYWLFVFPRPDVLNRRTMTVKGWGGMQWSKWVVVCGACIASSAAIWWYIRKQTRHAVSGSKSGVRPTASVAPCPMLFPGVESSKKVKDKGNEYFKQYSYKKAVEAFTEAINLCPPEYKNHLAVCYQNRAAAYDRLGDPERSIMDCTKALELDPLYFKAVVRRAKAYLSLSRPEEALDDLTYAFVMSPETSESLKMDVDSAVALAAANLVEHIKNTRESIPVRDELVLLWRSSYVNDPILHDLKEESLSVSPYHQALEAIRQRHYEEVIPLIENDLLVQQSDPNHLNVTYILRDYILQARFALMKENVMSLKERLASFDSMWNAMNEDSRREITNKRFRSMYYILLAAWKILEHCSDIESEFNRAVEIDQTNVDIYLGAALLLSENGQLQEAIGYLDQLNKIDPAHHLVKHMRANCAMALKASIGDVGGAMACMTKVDQLLQMNQNADPVLYLITGRLYYAAQNKELAKASFKKAAEGIPDYAAPMFYLAMVEAEEMEDSPNQMAVLESRMKICLEREKANPDALAILAKIAFQRQQLDEALHLYEQCIEVCPVHTNEASLLPAVTDYVQIRSLRKAIETLRRTTSVPTDALYSDIYRR